MLQARALVVNQLCAAHSGKALGMWVGSGVIVRLLLLLLGLPVSEGNTWLSIPNLSCAGKAFCGLLGGLGRACTNCSVRVARWA